MQLAPPTVIGLCGFGSAGKGSVAEALCMNHGFVERAFADKVRQFAEAVDAYLPEIGETYSQAVKRMGYEQAKRTHPCIRQYLVKIGHCARTVLYKDVWLDAALPPVGSNAYKDLLKTGPRFIVVSDCRYRSESDRVREYGGQVWRITRPGCAAANETEGASVPDTPCDIEIPNDGSLLDLRRKVTDRIIVYLASKM